MVKRVALAIVAVYLAWSVMDFVIHGVILSSAYAETARLWRPMEEMKMGLMYVVTLIAASAFVGLYAWLIRPKSLAAGLKLGLVYGVATSVGMGYGSYAVMPIPYHLALAWFLGGLSEALVAGLLVGLIVKSNDGTGSTSVSGTVDCPRAA